MGHHPFDAIIVDVGRGFRIGQNIARIEDVEALILHRAEIEIGNGDDVEHVQIIFPAIDALVPSHAVLQRLHRMGGARQVGFLNPDAQLHVAPRHGHEMVGVAGKVARDQREQIAGFGIWIVPGRPMAAVRLVALLDRVAIGQQDRKARLVCDHMHAVARENVRAIGEEGDAAKALRLALGAEQAAAGIKTHQLAVALRRQFDQRLDLVRRIGQRDDEGAGLEMPFALREQPAVHLHLQRHKAIAVQPQRPVMIAIARHGQPRTNLGQRGIKIEMQRDIRHQPVGRAIVGTADDCGRGGGGGVHVHRRNLGSGRRKDQWLRSSGRRKPAAIAAGSAGQILSPDRRWHSMSSWSRLE